MAIRAVYMGPEAAEGTLAATLFFNRVESWQPVGDAKLDIPVETTNSTITDIHPVAGPTQGNFTAKVRAYYDMSVHWFAMTLGLPTVVDNPGSSTGTHDHTFTPGGYTQVPYSVVWKQVGSKGVIWRQMTGCRGKSLKATIEGNKGLIFEIQGHGYYPGSSVAQVGADNTAAYIQPVALNQQALTLNTLAWKKPKKFDVLIDTGLAPDWSIQSQRGYDRLKPANTKGTADIQAYFDAYSGSLIAIQDSATQLANVIIFTAQDGVSNIGTGTMTHPSLTWTLPKPYIEGATEDSTQTDPEEKAKATLAYDPASLSNMTIKFHNELAATVYTGT